MKNPTEEIDIHQRRKKIASLLETINNSKLSPNCKKALQGFYDLNQGSRINTQHKDLDVAYNYLLWHNAPTVEAITKEQNKKWWAYWLGRYNKGEIKHGTLEKEYWLTKKFLRKHFDMKKGRYPNQIDTIELPKKPEELDEINLPTQAQMKEIIEKHALATCPNSNGNAVRATGSLNFRNQALLALLNDDGCRITEAISMNICDKEQAPGKHYLINNFPISKTKPRKNIGYLCKPYITKWLQNYNYDNPETAPLFPDRFGKRMTYAAARQVVIRAFASAGIKLPHRKATSVFRHMAASRFNWNSDLKSTWFGWSKKKAMSMNYTHFGITDFEKAYFETNKDNPMMPRECAICGATGAQGFCEQCGATLGLDNVLNKASQYDHTASEIMNQLTKNPTTLKIIAKALAQNKEAAKLFA